MSGGYRFPLRRACAARVLQALDPDLIEAGDPYRLSWAALDAGQALGVPVTTFCHSDVEQLMSNFGGTFGAGIARRYLKRLYRRFDAVFAASRWMVARLSDLGLDNVIHQPLGVDLATFHPRRRDSTWRLRIGLEPSSYVLLYAGRFAPEKHLDQLSAAVDRLGAPYELVVIGHGPVAPSGRRVHVLPPESSIDALATALASADCFVHAGDNETFGLAALEAMACGTPVVARNRAGIADLLDGVGAVGVDADGIEPLAEAIAAMRAGDAQVQRASARTRALHWDQDTTFARLIGRYLQLADRTAVIRPWRCAYV
jgi:alpha-1,6-mannosyltransferase